MHLTIDDLRARFPLPDIDPAADKHGRGVALVIGGTRATAGAVVLAGTAALRAGAGKLRIATVASAVPTIATAVPEAGVFGLRETENGDIADDVGDEIAAFVATADAVLVGTGMLAGAAQRSGAHHVLKAVLAAASTNRSGPPVAIDACAVAAAARDPARIAAATTDVLLLPNVSEANELDSDAAHVAQRYRATVAVRGPTTTIASPDGTCVEVTTGNVGLATSGSGDVEAGIVVGLLACGADPVTAAAWASYVHGLAGERLARRIAPVGYLARELLDEIPSLLRG